MEPSLQYAFESRSWAPLSVPPAVDTAGVTTMPFSKHPSAPSKGCSREGSKMRLPRCLGPGHFPFLPLGRPLCSPAGPPTTLLSLSDPQLAQILPTEENFLLCFRQHVGSSAEFMEVRLRRRPPRVQSRPPARMPEAGSLGDAKPLPAARCGPWTRTSSVTVVACLLEALRQSPQFNEIPQIPEWGVHI